MTAPVGAFLLAGLQVLNGTFALMWANTIVFRVIDRGHYRSSTWILFPLMLAIAFALPRSTFALGLAASGLAVLFLLAVYSQRPLAEWTTGAVATVVGLWLVVSTTLSECPNDCGTATVNSMAGTLLLGAVVHAMVLGHWYLNQPRLPIQPLTGAARALLLMAAAAVVVGIATRSSLVDAQVPGSLLAFSGSGYWWAWLLLMGGTLVLGLMVASTVRRRSTQSATGLLYVAILPVLVAQFVLNLLILS